MAMFDLHFARAVMIVFEILKVPIKSLRVNKDTRKTDLVKRRFVELLLQLEIKSTVEKVQELRLVPDYHIPPVLPHSKSRQINVEDINLYTWSPMKLLK